MAAPATFTRTEGGPPPGFTPAPTTPVQSPPPVAQAQPQLPQERPAAAPSATLDVVLPDGRTVVLARPDVACQPMVYRILGGFYPDGVIMPGASVTMKSLMYLKSIDGKVVSRPYDHVQAQALMNTLGDEGTEIVAGAYLQHFLMQKTALPLSGR